MATSLQVQMIDRLRHAWSSGIVNGTPSFVESLISVFHFQRPIQYDEEVKWYKARSEALSIYGSMLSRQFPDEIESEMRMMFLSSLLHTVKIECWRLQTSAEPPFPRIAEEQNEKLLLQCSSLVMVIFTQHPGIFDEDQMEEPITEALSMLSAVTQEAWGSHHQIHSIIRKILKKLQAYRNKKTSKHLQNSSPMIID
ncbi:uncharacterized protein BYT42DRAFT_81714 [Radiomyces spectabilis]|uniref:uncharacterized protein n=1 Tax=Radiomyces spectabilis TaxID=64574 RepID=UPI00222003EF|nr:uncharacterized protein BYT42DRAFT_81714 [Radiomyces spectabilis]KAI8371781.1 hypothetical protein BYT42DRAFT_81714 [Radiomyces spectabilis]